MTHFNEPVKKNQQLKVPLNLQISFIDSAFLGLVSRWLEDGMIYTPRYMTQSVAKMLDQFSGENVSLVIFFDGELEGTLEKI